MGRTRRIFLIIVCLVLLAAAVPLGVQAAGTVNTVDVTAYVSADGSCQVTMAISLYLDTPAEKLTIPLHKDARDVTANGVSVRTTPSSTDPNALTADLSFLNGLVGNVNLTVHYDLKDVLRTQEQEDGSRVLCMDVPILSGLDWPVNALSFSVNLPNEITGKPSFSSAFLQTNIEAIIACTVDGKQITGTTTAALQDRETLTLTMQVPEQIFPGKLELAREGAPELWAMGICAAAALLYWLVFMRCLPLVRQRRTTPLDGVTAGELGSHLTAAGADLTMMVFTWAQLGYIRIKPDKYGRVYLQKRMDMGNERTEFENHCFQQLFAKRGLIDATAVPYARYCRKAATVIPGVKEMYRRRSGSIRLFRALSCGISLFSGISFALSVSRNTLIQVLLCVLFGILGVFSAWAIQSACFKLHVRGKVPLYVGSFFELLWILAGILCGQWLIGLLAVLAQLMAGLGAAYGGRRTALGRYQGGEILGLRHYLKHLPRDRVDQILENNPDYFFDMLPYAIALGVDGPFARSFGGRKLPPCPYLTARENEKRSPQEWALLLRKTADRMDDRQRKMELEQWIPIGIRKP